MVPKHLKTWVIAGAIVVVGVVAVVMVLIGRSEPPPVTIKDKMQQGEMARLQIRSDPSRMEVLYNLEPHGKTPLMLVVPRSDTAVDLKVRFPHGHVVTKSVIPNVDHQVVDFKDY